MMPHPDEPLPLEAYRFLMALTDNQRAVAFLEKKAAESPRGWQEPVLADFSQMMTMLISMRHDA